MGLAKVASLLLKEVPDIDAVDDSGKTALQVAMERGFENAVEILVNSGASVDLGSMHGQNVFLLIVENDWMQVADIVAAKVRRTTSKETSQNGVVIAGIELILAAYDGNDSAIEKLLESDQSEDSKLAEDILIMALLIAVERQKVETVQTLLDSGVNIDCQDNMGQTALHRATRRESAEIVEILLRKGAQVDLKNDEGRTPWSANIRSKNKSVLNMLLQAGADSNTKAHQGVSELYNAATDGETDLVRYMLEAGTDPSIKTQFLWTPLHWAAYYGHIECVKILIDAGAELSSVSDQDASPLDLALRANQFLVVNILTRAGAKESRDLVKESKAILSSADETTDSWNPIEGQDISQNVSKLSLAFDKPLQQGLNVGQYFYPSSLRAPKDYIYEISATLDTMSNCLGVRRASRRADMIEYPLDKDAYSWHDSLFVISRVELDYQTLELQPQGQSTLEGVITMHRDWTGGWKVHHGLDGNKEYLFRTTPDWSKMKEESCRWMTEEGRLLARTGVEGVTPFFIFEHGSERTMQEILVTCWVAKLWSETVALQRRGVDDPAA